MSIVAYTEPAPRSALSLSYVPTIDSRVSERDGNQSPKVGAFLCERKSLVAIRLARCWRLRYWYRDGDQKKAATHKGSSVATFPSAAPQCSSSRSTDRRLPTLPCCFLLFVCVEKFGQSVFKNPAGVSNDSGKFPLH